MPNKVTASELRVGKPELKAYELNTGNLDTQNESIQRGYIDPVHGKTEHEARRKMLKKCYDHGIEETWFDEPLTYVNIMVRRSPRFDLYLVGERLMTLDDIEYQKKVISHADMIKQMLADNPNSYAYIMKGGYYYQPNKCGYTEYQTNAGVYTMADAVKECLGCDYRDCMRPILIDTDAHNKLINDKITQLQAKLITPSPATN